MREVQSRVSRLPAAILALAFSIGAVTATASPAEARSKHRHHGGHHRPAAHKHHAGAAKARGWGGYLAPTYASIIVDANTGRTLAATNENSPHHPASVTKVMTLYLLFEELEKGRLNLDSELTISAHAASQSPSKLGLRPGSTIAVEDAIKALVTKSANDIACAIAENVAGDEDTFAQMMTRRARSLGMNGTTFRNASGLPNPQQITTARDLAILGRAIQDRFPRHYRYFATRTFYYAGRAMPNHNHLLGRVEGMDGIKTGYTAASGFNLLTSVKRDGRHIIGVVLGGRTGPQRDRIMAGLIEDNLMDGAARRTAVAMTERDEDMAEQSARVMESAPTEEVDARPVAMIETRPPAEPRAETRPEARRTETAGLNLALPPSPIRSDAQVEKARPAYVTATPRADAQSAEKAGLPTRKASDGSTRTLAYAAAAPTATPSSLRWAGGLEARTPKKDEAPRAAAGKTEVTKTEAKTADSKVATGRPSRTGWMIQIGATDDADEANDLLAKARKKAALGSAKAFTEKVQKGRETLWRARFAGLEEDSAEAACKSLKRSGFSCFATKN